MKKNPERYVITKLVVRAILLSLAITFFLSIFRNSIRITNYSSEHWYYINRGYPISWSGTSIQNLATPFPVVKAPFLSPTAHGISFHKVIDLSIFLPIVLTQSLIYSAIFYCIYRIVGRVSFKRRILFFDGLLIFMVCVSYFIFFPRI